MGGDVKPVRLRLSRQKGFDLQALSQATNGLRCVAVGRPSAAGNPWTVRAAREAGYTGTDTDLAGMCVRYFREWTSGDEGSLTRMLKDSDARLAKLRAMLPHLSGKNLACWCALNAPCHADVLIDIVNAPAGRRALTDAETGANDAD